MPQAVIYLDPAGLRPVVDGRWHHARLTDVPAPGDAITMLCGVTADAAFEHAHHRDAHGVPHACWHCDLAYRREHGMDIRPDHPALSARPTP